MNMWRPPAAQPVEANTPAGKAFRDGRRVWDERMGEAVASARAWRNAGFLGLVTGAAGVGVAAWLSVQGVFVPWVVVKDRAGHYLEGGPADRTKPLTDVEIAADLNDWVAHARTVYTDVTAMQDQIRRAYAMVAQGSQAWTMLVAFHQATRPEELAKTMTVRLDQQTALPVGGSSSHTWNLDWRERRIALDGKPLSTTCYRMSVSFTVSPPRDAQTLRVNPDGIFIQTFDWQEYTCDRSRSLAQ